MEPLLRMFGASDATLGLSIDYFKIILLFIPVYMMANVMNPIIRADGSPLGSMVATLVETITNIILDPIFIFRLDMEIFINIIKLGISIFITQMSIVIISLVCNIMLAKYGAMSKYGADISLTTIGICMKVFTIVINIVVGIILGTQPILGYNF